MSASPVKLTADEITYHRGMLPGRSKDDMVYVAALLGVTVHQSWSKPRIQETILVFLDGQERAGRR